MARRGFERSAYSQPHVWKFHFLCQFHFFCLEVTNLAFIQFFSCTCISVVKVISYHHCHVQAAKSSSHSLVVKNTCLNFISKLPNSLILEDSGDWVFCWKKTHGNSKNHINWFKKLPCMVKVTKQYNEYLETNFIDAFEEDDIGSNREGFYTGGTPENETGRII